MSQSVASISTEHDFPHVAFLLHQTPYGMRPFSLEGCVLQVSDLSLMEVARSSMASNGMTRVSADDVVGIRV